jgi:hypothetical protein
MSEKPQLTPQQAALLTASGFVQAFLQKYWNNKPNLTQREAYEIVEQHYQAITGTTRYRDFESFKPTLYRHLKK